MKFSQAGWILMALAWTCAHCLAADAAGAPRDQIEGQALAADLRAMRPAGSFTNQATLRLRDAEGQVRRLPLTIANRVGEGTSWEVTYAASGPTSETLTLVRAPDRPPEYHLVRDGQAAPADPARAFAGSDFSLRELGLEFLHWPGQRILPRSPPPMKKGQPCKILESTNPKAPGYTRVVSWVSIEHNGLMLADAYDATGRIVKRFSIGSLKKVNGVWQLRDMEMIDEVRGTETRLEFQLEAKE
ncbi:MAG: outer membrane lipoprotein-sorting protein [Verrucomicrobiae bacterium]|nr:outer membrane lipoprotein-sorting protein [Verrucomicrobiae bacterium]